jgi:hypothetical protein
LKSRQIPLMIPTARVPSFAIFIAAAHLFDVLGVASEPAQTGIGVGDINRVSDRIFIERSDVRILTLAFCDSFDEINWSWDTVNWLDGYGDRVCLSILTALLKHN